MRRVRLMEIDRSALSPMMQQYFAVKDEHPGYVVFFRLGDFYEMFFDDAVVVSKALELTLTGRDCGLSERAPMCGIPYHARDIYIKKLVDMGFKIAIAEQMEDPKLAKGLVKREVIKLVTPGTLTDSDLLNEESNNFLSCLYADRDASSAAFALADISTGTAKLFVFRDKEKLAENIENELARWAPAELLVNSAAKGIPGVEEFAAKKLELSETVCEDAIFDVNDKLPLLLSQFNAAAPGDIGVDEADELSLSALCGLFYYICDTQRTSTGRFTQLDVVADQRYMTLDLTAVRNLEITETIRTKEKKGSLLWVIDHTRTSMGKRLLKAYIEQPLIKLSAIVDRHRAVEELCGDPITLDELRTSLEGVYDLERLMTRVVYKTATPRDVKALGKTAERCPELKRIMAPLKAPLLAALRDNIHELTEISALVENAIVDEPAAQIKDGGIIKDGFNKELDHCRDIIKNGKGIIQDIEQRERDRTGIKNLKIGYNHVFGYYIEVTKSYYSLVPPDYVRKQTLANCERFITDELKRTEEEMAGAGDRAAVLEGEIFSEVRDFIASKLSDVQQTGQSIAAADVLCSFADVSLKNNYTRPDMGIDGVIDIREGRHPVVEAMPDTGVYVPNNTYLDNDSHRMAIITGPNMAGKSTYMRQTALIVLLAQIGCFVPAQSAHISVVDRIFTRVGASDDVAGGQSTFMVEMSEVSEILKNATRNSLVILDEVGRGTSTIDGISIATAVAEYIANKRHIGCKTMFATHYHELVALEGKVDGVRNYSIAVKKSGEDVKFLRKIVEGGADKSYGIEVAKLAGLPKAVLGRAKEIMRELESASPAPAPRQEETQVSFGAMNEEEVIRRIRMTNPDEYSPREALALLWELYDMLG